MLLIESAFVQQSSIFPICECRKLFGNIDLIGEQSFMSHVVEVFSPTVQRFFLTGITDDLSYVTLYAPTPSDDENLVHPSSAVIHQKLPLLTPSG